ncbi:MAG: DUF4276 family protein [Thermoguttaceae bacterium]|jgi:hypothetical protein
MKELYVFCEGPTEQGFCNQVLSSHLRQFTCFIHTIKVAHSRHHGIIDRGGIGKYETLRFDIQSTIKSRKQNQGVFFTTMIDLYGLPSDFPGKANHDRNPQNPRPYCEALEQAFGADIGDVRFVPHLQLHEYETLLYADPDAFRFSFDDCDRAIASLKRIAAEFREIERINDGELTAPSKRIIGLLEAYAGMKPTAGPDIAEYIGLDALRQHCFHFNDWISRLENLGQGS